MVIEVKFLQLSNASSPISLTLSEMVTFFRLVKSLNMLFPMCVTPSLIVTDVILSLESISNFPKSLLLSIIKCPSSNSKAKVGNDTLNISTMDKQMLTIFFNFLFNIKSSLYKINHLYHYKMKLIHLILTNWMNFAKE